MKTTNTSKKLRIAGYVRVSSVRQATEGDSLQAQQHEIEQEIEFRKRRENWDIESLEFYTDAGKSAKDQNRPELQRLKRDIAAGEIDVVICFKLDRITRSLKDFVDLWELFNKHKVDVISLREKFDTSMPTGEAMIQLIMVFAQLERKMTAERTASIMRDRVERGLWNGGHILGYRSRPQEPGYLEIDEEGAAIVRTIFDSFEKLGSCGAVTREMSEKGIRYPSYATRSGKQRGGNLFAKQKVTGILRNPVYIGKIRWGQTVHDGNHPPIIQQEQFDRVQAQLATVVKRKVGLKAKPKGRHYLLTSVLRCVCGAHMVGYSTPGRSRIHYYYACTKQLHEGGRYSCSSPKIPAEAMEKAILHRLRNISASVEAREKIVEQALSCLSNESAKMRQEEEVLKRQQQRTRADISRLIEVLKSSGAKGLSSVQTELTKLESEDLELERRCKELAKRQNPLNQISEDARKFVQNWAEVESLLDEATEEEKTQLVRHYVEVIEIHPSDTKGEAGTYVMKLFPEVRTDWRIGWSDQYLSELICDDRRLPETKNGDAAPEDSIADLLTEPRLVCISDGKAPPVGLEPTTRRLTAACSTS